MASRIIFESVSPNGQATAIVEQTAQAYFLYLTFSDPVDTRVLWLSNRVRAPAELDVTTLQAGTAVANPRAFCLTLEAQAELDATTLELVWLPEGNGAGLYDGQGLLAALPPWAGLDGFRGYSRHAQGQGPLAWELNQDNAFFERLRHAAEFWQQWQGDPWAPLQKTFQSKLEAVCGTANKSSVVNTTQWPPLAVTELRGTLGITLASIGMCIQPQPGLEYTTSPPANASALKRIELAVLLPIDSDEPELQAFTHFLGKLMLYPWASHTYLAPGQTLECDLWRNKSQTHALLAAAPAGLPELDYGRHWGDSVTVLWLLPATP